MALLNAILVFALSITVSKANPDSLRLSIKESQNFKTRVDLYYQLAKEVFVNEPHSVKPISDSILFYSEKAKYSKGYGLYHLMNGKIHQKTGDFTTAYTAYQKSLSIFKRLRNRSLEAEALKDLGVLFYDEGNLEKAMSLFNESKTLYEQLYEQKPLAYLLNDLGNINYAMEHFDEAETMYDQALTTAIEIKDSAIIAKSYNNLGSVLYEKGKLKKSLELHRKSLAIKHKLGNYEELSISYNNIGDVYFKMKRSDSAFTYQSRALGLIEKFRNPYNRIYTINKLAEIELEQKNYRKVFKYLQESVNEAAKNGFKKLQIDALELKKTLYQNIEDFEQAYLLSEQIGVLKREILNEKNLRSLNEMMAVHKTRLKENENNLLRLENEQKDQKLGLQRSWIIVIISVVLLLVFISIVLLHLMKTKKLAYEELEQTHEEINTINTRLEEIVQERNALLAQRNSQIEQYAFVNSHELRAPLARLLGLIDLLRIEQIRDSEDAEDILEKLKTESKILDKIVRKINEDLSD